MSRFVPALLPVCGSLADLPAALRDAADALTAVEDVEPSDVEPKLRCVLQAHVEGDHEALVQELTGVHSGSVWTSWSDGQGPAELVVRSDCSARRTDDACCSYAHHPGGHSYEVSDPWHFDRR